MSFLKGGTIGHSLYRGALVFLSFAITMLVTGDNGWTTVTLGAVVSAFLHWVTSQLAETK